MILHMKNPKDLKKKMLFKLINKFSKFVGYKINMHYEDFLFFIYNEPSEREIKKTVAFTIAQKIITYLEIFGLNAANY